MFSILLGSFLRGAFEALFKILFGLLGSLILKLSFGEKGLKVRSKLGKADSPLFAFWIGFLPVAWIALLLYIIFSQSVEFVTFLVAVPSIFSLWVFFSRKKIKRTLDENPAFLEENNEYHIKRESLDKFYEKYGNGYNVKINTIPKEDLESRIGNLYYKLKYDKFSLIARNGSFNRGFYQKESNCGFDS